MKALPILLCFFVMGFADAMGPLADTVKNQYGLSSFMAALVPAFVFVAFAIFSVPGGVLAARIGKRSLLLLALGLTALGVLVPTVVVPGYAVLLGAIFVLGVGATLLQVAGNPIMRDVSPPGHYARNLSFAQFVKGVGSAGSTALIGWLALGGTNWRRLFPIFLAVILVSFVVVLLLRIQETRADVPPGIGQSLGLLRERVFGLAVLGIFLYVGAEVCLTYGLARHLEGLGLTEAENGAWYLGPKFLGPTLFFACLTAGRLVGGLLSRIPPRVSFRLSAGLGILGLAALMLGTAPIAVAGVVVCGFAFANIWPLLFSITVERRPERSSELSGLMCMAICGGAILPPLMGFVRDSAGSAVAFLIPTAAFAYLTLLALTGGRQSQEA